MGPGELRYEISRSPASWRAEISRASMKGNACERRAASPPRDCPMAPSGQSNRVSPEREFSRHLHRTRLPGPGHPRGPGPHNPLPRRPNRRVQPRPQMPHAPSRQTGPRLEGRAAPAWRLPLDPPLRSDPHHPPQQLLNRESDAHQRPDRSGRRACARSPSLEETASLTGVTIRDVLNFWVLDTVS
jgi:hypothetical protein